MLISAQSDQSFYCPFTELDTIALRKQAYSNILKILSPKNENSFFHIYFQNIDCDYSLEPPRLYGSYEYPQSMFLSRKKKNNV